MKNMQDKIALVDPEMLVELIDELSFARITIKNEIMPVSKNLKKVSQDLDKTLKNFDAVLAAKTSEVIDKIDINIIHREVVKKVLEKFEDSIEDVNQLSKLSVKIRKMVELFHQKYDEIEKILNMYEKRILTTKYVSRVLNFSLILLTFGLGACFYPALLYISRHI